MYKRQAQGIGYFGDDDTYITEIKGVTIGIVGYTYPINEGKLKKYQKKIEELRDCLLYTSRCV